MIVKLDTANVAEPLKGVISAKLLPVVADCQPITLPVTPETAIVAAFAVNGAGQTSFTGGVRSSTVIVPRVGNGKVVTVWLATDGPLHPAAVAVMVVVPVQVVT